MTETSSFMYLDDLLDQKVPIYVRNIHPKKGIIVLTLNDGHRTHREAIPNTKYPICLSHKATPTMIRNSRDLRLLLDKKALELVDAVAAEKELAQKGVHDKLRSAYDRIGFDSPDVRASRKIGEEIGNADGPSPIHNGPAEGVTVVASPGANPYEAIASTGEIVDAEPDNEFSGVNVRVQALVESWLEKDMRSREVRSELSSMELEEADLVYLIDNTKGIIQKFAKEQFATLTSGDEVDELAFLDDDE